MTGSECSAFVFLEGNPVPSVASANTAPLTIAQAAEALATSTSTIRRMISRGELRAYRYGPRLIRIDPADLQAIRQQVNPVGYAARGGDAA